MVVFSACLGLGMMPTTAHAKKKCDTGAVIPDYVMKYGKYYGWDERQPRPQVTSNLWVNNS